MSKIVNTAKQIFIKLRKSLGTAFYNKILQSSGPFCCGVRVTRSLILCVVLCRSVFVPLSFFF
jgi:hypothetical protein